MASNRARVGCALILGAGVVAALTLSLADGDGASQTGAGPAPERAPPDVVALLDGIRPGDRAGAWEVRAVLPPVDGQARVEVVNQGALVTVWIARKKEGAKPPPAQSERYQLFYSSPHPPDAAGAREPIIEVLADLERRIRKRESQVAIPKGL